MTDATARSYTPFLFLSFVYLCLYIASFIAFAVFVVREESTAKPRIFAVLLIVVGLVVLRFRAFGVIGNGVMVAACFYVADRKNRSRIRALAALLFGPLVLLLLVFLPKLEDTSSGLHLTS